MNRVITKLNEALLDACSSRDGHFGMFNLKCEQIVEVLKISVCACCGFITCVVDLLTKTEDCFVSITTINCTLTKTSIASVSVWFIHSQVTSSSSNSFHKQRC